MSSRPPAHSLSFEIKSASLPLVSFIVKSADITLVAQDLQAHFWQADARVVAAVQVCPKI
jgi:hypothetical protein